MFLEALEVRGIRNLKHQLINFDKRVTVISGQNGQGKTSLLEAVFLLSHSRSFRTSQIRDVVSRQQKDEGAAVRGVVRSDLGKREITLEILNGRRTLLLDGKRAESAGQFFGQLRCVTFTPEELQLVKGAPQIRRFYLDRTLSMISAEYLSDLVMYQRALKQRNALLSQHVGVGDERALLPWESLLIEHGERVAKARDVFLREISAPCLSFYQKLCEKSEVSRGEHIALQYQSDFYESGKLLSSDRLHEEFAASRGTDRRLRSTQFGIHRDELSVKFSANDLSGPARTLSSQGQARSISIALKLAAIEYIEARTGASPIVLLDDVESELDSLRRAGLFEFLQASTSQVIITTTDPSWAPSHPSLDVCERRIEAGLLRSL